MYSLQPNQLMTVQVVHKALFWLKTSPLVTQAVFDNDFPGCTQDTVLAEKQSLCLRSCF